MDIASSIDQVILVFHSVNLYFLHLHPVDQINVLLQRRLFVGSGQSGALLIVFILVEVVCEVLLIQLCCRIVVEFLMFVIRVAKAIILVSGPCLIRNAVEKGWCGLWKIEDLLFVLVSRLGHQLV